LRESSTDPSVSGLIAAIHAMHDLLLQYRQVSMSMVVHCQPFFENALLLGHPVKAASWFVPKEDDSGAADALPI